MQAAAKAADHACARRHGRRSMHAALAACDPHVNPAVQHGTHLKRLYTARLVSSEVPSPARVRASAKYASSSITYAWLPPLLLAALAPPAARLPLMALCTSCHTSSGLQAGRQE